MHTQALTLAPSLLEAFQQKLPDMLYMVVHPRLDIHGLYCHMGVNGLAVCSSREAALVFSAAIAVDGMEVQEVGFDEARDIAKSKSPELEIEAVILCDDEYMPEIHFIS